MNETALVVEAYEAGIGHGVVALIQERDAEWARATDAETLERLAAQRLAEVEAERDALRAQLDGMTTQFGWALKYGGLIFPFTHDAPRPEDQYTTKVRRLVGPWVEVTG